MKLGLWLRLLWVVGAYCGCGGSEFTVSVFPDSGQPLTASADAGDVADASSSDHPVMMLEAGTHVPKYLEHDDAGASAERDAGDAVESSAPAADSAGPSMAAGDAPDEPAPPPPALCCMTPCSGSSVAPIACGNGPAWDCAAGTCTDRACSVGAVCHWMGVTCVGQVMLCP